MSPLVERDGHPVFLDLDRRGDFQQIAEERLGLGLAIRSADSLGEEAIQRAGHQGDLQIEVDLQADH